MKCFAIGTLCLIVFAANAEAREECGYPDLPFEMVTHQLARVTVDKAHFHNEMDKRQPAFVVKGDEVIVDGIDNEFICATFINAKGEATSNWVKAADLEIFTPDPVPADAWVGDWTAGMWQNLTIGKAQEPGWLAISGEAYWAANDEAAVSGGLHTGGVEGEAPLENNVVGFTQDDDGAYVPYSETARDDFKCAIRLMMIGQRYLLAEDSISCGGANVSFNGYYARGKVEMEFAE